MVNGYRHLDWVDRWKGMLIFLVVLGHAVGTNTHMTSGMIKDVYEAVYRAIYSFHMPAFFFLAGMTFGTSSENFKRFAYKKFLRLMVPYYCFGLFSAVIYLATYSLFRSSIGGTDGYYDMQTGLVWWEPIAGLLYGGNLPGGHGLRMNAVLWFLPCLFSAELFFWWLNRRVSPSKIIRIVLCIAFASLAFVIRINGWIYWPFGLDKIPYLMVFLLLGSVCGPLPDWQMQGLRRWKWLGVCLSGIVGFMIWMWLMPDLYAAWCNVWWYVFFGVAAVAGIFLSVTAAQLVHADAWRILGISSLGIMLIHKFILLGLQFKLPVVRTLVEMNLAVSALATIGVTVFATTIAWVSSRVILRVCPFCLGKYDSLPFRPCR